MKALTINEANSVFVCNGRTDVKIHNIQAPMLKVFHRNISKFLGTIWDNSKDDFWVPIIRGLKRVRFDISAAPLRQDAINKSTEELHNFLQNKIYPCELMYGNEPAALLRILTENLKQIYSTKQDYLLDALINFSQAYQMRQGAIAICEARLIPLVEESLANQATLNECVVLSPMNLREGSCYEKVAVFGAPRWFPEYVFSAPRTSEIHLFKYRWISGKWEPLSVFTTPYKYKGKVQRPIAIGDSEDEINDENPGDLLSEIDIKSIEDKAFRDAVNLVDDNEDVVRARLFVLEEDWAVFLEADDNSRADVVDLDEETTKRVKRIPIREIEQGMYILLRTEGGGDYIVPVADKIMGKFMNKARTAQQEWKSLLRDKVKRLGLNKVVRQLGEHGSPRANETNVKNWMAYRGIKTENIEDFQAIMKFVGLGSKTNEYWKIMEEIRKAHMRAGMEIRKMLLEKVNNTDLDILNRYGKMEFELAEKEAGKLAAFRVKVISKETTEVIYWKVGVPFRTD
jgi:hypothetical protein